MVKHTAPTPMPRALDTLSSPPALPSFHPSLSHEHLCSRDGSRKAATKAEFIGLYLHLPPFFRLSILFKSAAPALDQCLQQTGELPGDWSLSLAL